MAAPRTTLVFVLDLEATGLSTARERIIQMAVSAAVWRGADCVRAPQAFSRHVNPELPVPPFIAKLTGVTDADVRGAPTFPAVWREFTAWAAHVRATVPDAFQPVAAVATLAHNGRRYDFPLLDAEQIGRAHV